MPLGDLQLLVLRIARNSNDLHPVHERRRNVERVSRGHEHHARQIIVDLQIVIIEGRVLLRIEHLEQRRRRIATKIHAHLVDLVEQEERIGSLGLAHRLDDLARHRADIGAAMAADLRLVAHAAERHADEFPARRPRDRLAERGLADARRSHQTQNRPGQLVGALLDGEVFDNAFLDFVETEMIGVQDRLGGRKILLDLRALLPRDREQPIEIVAHDSRLRRHRRHLPQLFDLAERLLACFLGEPGRLDALLELGHFVLALLVAEFLLDRLHLLVEVVLALGLLHLPLDAGADALLNLKHRDLAFHQRQALLEPLGDRTHLENRLLVGEFDGKMRGYGVGKLPVVIDLVDRAHDLG